MIESPDTPLDAEDAKLVTLARGARARAGAAEGAAVRDEDGRTYAAATVGLPSLTLTALQAAVAAMWAAGAATVTAWIGPHICGGCYEVPEAMADAVEAGVPGSRSTTRWGTAGLDLGAGARGVLERLGVTVLDVGGCTLQAPDLHSHRRDAAASGRQAGIIWRADACRREDAG